MATAATHKKINGTQRKSAIKKTVAPKNNFPEFNHQIVWAFKCGGVDYFQFSDFNNMPPLRSLKTLVFYEEMRMKCSMEYLKLHVEANKNIFSTVKINSTELDALSDQVKQGLSISLENDFFKTVIKAFSDQKKLNDQLEQRLFIAVDLELMFKVASIVYFDKQEDIRDYDFEYNARKVEHWRKNKGTDFFLLEPVQELLPILKDMSENLETFFSINQQVNSKHLENLLLNLPESVKSKLKNSSFSNAVVFPPQPKR